MLFSPRPALLSACAVLAAGGGGAAIVAWGAGAQAAPTSSASAYTTQVVHTGMGTISLTGPEGKTHTQTGPVTCKVVKGRYVVLAGKRHTRSGTSLRVGVKDYKGAGSYTGAALITRHHRASFSGRRYRVPVTLTSTGGSFTYSKTLSGKRHLALKGKTISAKASWTCSV